MVKKSYIVCCLLSLFVLTGCEDLDFSGFFSCPSDVVDQRFKKSMNWNNSHDIVHLNLSTTHYGIMVCGDTHVNDTHKNWSIFLNKLRNDSLYNFGIVVGDLSNGKGKLQEFYDCMRYDSLTQKSNDTIFVTTGNHDLYYNDWNLYQKLFGTSVYYFTVSTPEGEDLFISLDSSSGTFGNKQKKWFEKLLKESRNHYRHCIVYSHVNLFDTDASQASTGNMPLEETAWLQNQLSKHRVDLYITGHDHYRESFEFGGVTYITLDALKDDFKSPTYLTIKVGQELALDFQALE